MSNNFNKTENNNYELRFMTFIYDQGTIYIPY